MRITTRNIGKIVPPAKEHGPRDVPDDLLPGLVLSVKPTGAMSWCVRYRFEGAQRRYTLGKHPAIGLTAARKLARKVLEKVAAGEDPQQAKVAQRTGDATDSFRALAARFIEIYARPRNRTWREAARILGLRLREDGWETVPGSPAERWAAKPVRLITKQDVIAAIDRAMEKGPIAGNKAYAIFSRFFNWAVERGAIDTSPLLGAKAPSPTKERERVLSLEELQIVWQAADTLRKPFSSFIHLLILTAARRSEVAGISREELDEDGVWTLPKERSKNEQELLLPLPPVVTNLLAGLPMQGLLLTTTGETPISGFSKLKRRLDTAIGYATQDEPLEPWTLHDLRRSASTGMASIGIEPHIVEAILNHRSGEIEGVARTYNRYTYFKEKKRALKRWAARFEDLAKDSEALSAIMG